MAPTTFLSSVYDALVQPYSPLVILILPITAALALHIAVQIREPYAHHTLVAGVLVFAGTTHLVHTAWAIPLADALCTTLSTTAVFTATMALSIATYRLFLHPLRYIPGPLSAKLTMWSWVLPDWRGQRAEQIRALHRVHGDVVRIGPREISCADPAMLSVLYGPGASTVRGPWYTAQSMHPDAHSLQNEPTLGEHARRRRDWDPAFSVKALSGYRENIRRNARALLAQLERFAAEGKVDVRECMMWFGFDVMGELGFGRSFGTLEAGETSAEVHLVELGVRSINAIGNVPYVAHVMRFLPSPIQKFESWLSRALDWRISHHGEREFVEADVFAFLLGEQGKQRRPLDRPELQQDCMLMVVAGSDTTSNAMTFCLYELARRPDVVRKLRAELDALDLDDFDAVRDQAPLLNACINEALRLWPPVPSGLQRTLLKPLTISRGDGSLMTIPSNTVVSTHTWTIHRDARNFSNPDVFNPDRWLETAAEKTDGFVHNAKAWAPFGWGATSCIGKNLAFMEMRLVLARVICAFDISISPQDDVAFRESIRDQFVIAAGSMRLRMVPRNE